MPRQAKRDAATASAEAPPLKKPVQAAVAESSIVSDDVRGIERPRRNCRLVAVPQQTTLVPLLSLAAQPIKEENCPSICATPPCTRKPKGKCHAAVDEHCPVSLSTHV